LKIAVIGGGISGLSTAFALKQRAQEQGRAIQLHVFEAARVLGGTMGVTQEGGFLCERGPNGFLDSKPHSLELVRQLGLGERLIRADPNAARRFVLVDGKLHQLPTTPMAFMTSSLLPFWGRMRVLWEPFVAKRRNSEPESVADFSRRRLGRHAFERLVDPFVSGVFAGDPERLSVNAAFPRLVELEQQYGSLIRASSKLKKERGEKEASAGPTGQLWSFPKGLGELVDALSEALGTAVRTEAPVKDLRHLNGQWTVTVAEGDNVGQIDHVIFAIPAFSAAKILSPLEPELSRLLMEISYAAVTVVALGFAREQVAHDLEGYGYLVPGRESRPILGCLFSSSLFPGHRAPQGHVLLRTIVGGARAAEIALMAEDELISLVMGELNEILGIQGEPVFKRLERHTHAIPQYNLGHLERVAQIDTELQKHRGLWLTGNAFRGVGINDCTRAGFNIAEHILSAAV
jgi:oxygen-dependent protoporphyrinogen oxidase